MMPKPPNVDMTRKPIEEQLAQVLEAIPRIEPENNDLSNFNSEFLITYTFMATNTPINTEVMFVRMNPAIASSGR
jgi:hypothetical protein